MRLALLICCLIFLVGCVSFQEKSFKIHKGHSETEVEQILGKPAQVSPLDGGGKQYTYYPNHNGFEYPYFVKFNGGIVVSWGPDPEREPLARAAGQQKAMQEQELGRAFQNLGNHFQNQRSPSGRVCNGFSVAPMASVGCRNVCIDGQWSQVCGD